MCQICITAGPQASETRPARLGHPPQSGGAPRGGGGAGVQVHPVLRVMDRGEQASQTCRNHAQEVQVFSAALGRGFGARFLRGEWESRALHCICKQKYISCRSSQQTCTHRGPPSANLCICRICKMSKVADSVYNVGSSVPTCRVL